MALEKCEEQRLCLAQNDQQKTTGGTGLCYDEGENEGTKAVCLIIMSMAGSLNIPSS